AIGKYGGHAEGEGTEPLDDQMLGPPAAGGVHAREGTAGEGAPPGFDLPRALERDLHGKIAAELRKADQRGYQATRRIPPTIDRGAALRHQAILQIVHALNRRRQHPPGVSADVSERK